MNRGYSTCNKCWGKMPKKKKKKRPGYANSLHPSWQGRTPSHGLTTPDLKQTKELASILTGNSRHATKTRHREKKVKASWSLIC
jgi:hypothetical protein